MLPAISIGRVVLPTGPLLIILGTWAALATVERAARRLSLDVVVTYGIASTSLIAGLIGARLAFVFLHWTAYVGSPVSILWPLNTGYNPLAGGLIGAVAAFLYGRAKDVPWSRTLDALAPAMLVGFLSISLSDLLAGPGYGDTTNLPWGISQYGIKRHPVQVYEMITGLLALAVWYRLLAHRPAPGKQFLGAVVVASIGLTFTDAFRATAWLTSEGYHVVQVLALGTSLICLILLARQAPGPAT